ncbi:hypothetical protein [Pelagibacterium sp. H642]|uniref:hypothetical protein n=1 Tax=Pelagibacterium sp. H642 TaxID=1881069 RepID=UPI002814B2A9|nr:hypothetical protein [Pelagibacterium sp. H642]WMT90148.1 hypothetical protein NO934_15320 [Pelagibacterium sp. H642]
MQRIKNLTNSPYDIMNAKGQKVRLPARGEIEVNVHPLHLPLYRTLGYFTISEGDAAPQKAKAKKKPPQPVDPVVAELRKEYQELTGKKPFNGWKAEELQKRIDAALAA